MKIYKIANKQYVFYTSCVNETDGSHIEDMVDNSEEVTWEEFSNNVDIEQIKNIFGDFYNYDDEDNGVGLLFQDDWAISFYKSQYRGVPCYYLYHSAIEYVFVPADEVNTLLNNY